MPYEEKISVIMSVYREKVLWLNKAIESVLEQTHANFEFIIVVDDPTRSDLVNRVSEYAKNDERIIVLINEKNEGLVYSLNRALKHVTSDYVIRMDADDISVKDRFEKQLIYLIDNKVDLVGSQVIFIDENGKKMFDTAGELHLSSKYIYKVLNFQNCIYHPSWMVKTSLYEKLNGYRNINYCEDFDFLLRAKNMGAQMANIAEPLVLYRYNNSGISRMNKATQRCITKYMCSKRKEIEKISVEEINGIIKERKKEVIDCEKYYRSSQEAIDAKSEGKIIAMFIASFQCILRTKNGRIKFIEVCRDKWLFLLEHIKV